MINNKDLTEEQEHKTNHCEKENKYEIKLGSDKSEEIVENKHISEADRQRSPQQISQESSENIQGDISPVKSGVSEKEAQIEEKVSLSKEPIEAHEEAYRELTTNNIEKKPEEQIILERYKEHEIPQIPLGEQKPRTDSNISEPAIEEKPTQEEEKKPKGKTGRPKGEKSHNKGRKPGKRELKEIEGGRVTRSMSPHRKTAEKKPIREVSLTTRERKKIGKDEFEKYSHLLNKKTHRKKGAK